MPDLSNALVQWLLSQSESVPASLLREVPGSGTVDRLVSSVLGLREHAHLRTLLSSPGSDAGDLCTILIPGIMGSLLASTVGISTTLWINPTLLLDGHLNLLDLASDGETDASPDVNIVPVGIEKMTYQRLIQTLAQRSRLYEFPYDWRRSVVATAHLLHDAIERWTSAEPGRRFSIVCHSMGGLVARAYMALYPAEAESNIDQLIMVGVPLHGAAIAALAFSSRLHPFLLVANLHERNRLSQFSLSLPSVYQLLPEPRELFTAASSYPFDWDIYDAECWPLSGVSQMHLDGARAYHELIDGSDPQLPMVNLAGCNRPTATAVYESPDPSVGLEPAYVEGGAGSGDEEVPLWSARDSNVITHYVEESHNSLVSNDAVLADIVALLRGEKPALPTTLPAASRSMKRTAASVVQQIAEIRERVESGTLSRLDIDRLFFWH